MRHDARMTTAHASRPAVSWFVGFVGGSLVNLGGVSAFLAGAGLWVYWVLMVLAVMAGAAACLSPRRRWFGVGLTTGCVAEFVTLLGLVLTWGTLAGSAVQ